METGWEVFPQGLTDTLLWIKDNYGNPPVYITENGAASSIRRRSKGTVLEDPLRVDYLRKHITAVYNAMQRGADIRGYFAWSLFDNFEWAYGFSKRFGIVHMNYETLQRTLKAQRAFLFEGDRHPRRGAGGVERFIAGTRCVNGSLLMRRSVPSQRAKPC